MPPGFFEQDMQKWINKFKPALENRLQEKQMLKARGCFQPVGTKNENVQNASKPRRRNSRMSTATFTGVDFQYSGNTNNVQHLIKSTTRAGRHPTQLNHELNLRTYRNSTNFTP